MKHFARLFDPSSIAVVGVSDDPVRPGSQAVDALLRNGYAGRVHPVNPKYSIYRHLKCYPSVTAIDADVDLAVIGVPARSALLVIEECAAKRVPYAVVLSGGFRESGPEGATLQERVLAVARAAGMRVVGPNCLGLANIHKDVYAAFGSITRPPRLRRGAVSVVTQSGGFGYSIVLACAAEGIGFRNIVTTGNEADIDTTEFISALLDDDETRIIIAYIEGLKNGRALLDAGRRALALGKPLLVWKGGVTEEGQRVAASHTASLTGSYDIYQALFKQAGIIEIKDIHEAADYVKAFEARKFPRGRRVAVMGGSGGSAIVFADAAEQAGLAFSSFSEDTKHRLSEVVPNIGVIHNPVDFTAGYIASGNAAKFGTAVQAVLDDPGVDAVCLNFATTAGAACLSGARVLNGLVERTDKPVVVFLSTPPSEASEALAAFEQAKIPVVPSPVRAARVIAVLAAYREARERNGQRNAIGGTGGKPLITHQGGALSESESKAVLARIGISVTRDAVVQSASEIPFESLKLPLAVKIVSPDIQHKTEVGAVKLGIRTRRELEESVAEVLANARAKAPQARIDGVMISEMVTGGFELLAGAVNDTVFGPVIVVGAGGIYAEALSDKTCRLAPFDEATAREMIGELQCSTILHGVRGKPSLDVDAVASALAALSRFAWDHRERISEIDINPLFVLPSGAVAADALIVCRSDGE